jgi:phosphatidylserine/phosphatidylglycerophosphate/cardiolipin synthase-like enzyme
MSGDPSASGELAAYLTGSEAKAMADRLEAGQPTQNVMSVVAPGRRPRVRELLDRAGLGQGERAATLAVLRAIEGAHGQARSIGTVWTAPGNLVQQGQLTASIHHYVDRARESLVCSTYNFQRSSALWSALRGAAGRPEVTVRIYMDTSAADDDPAPWKPTTAQVADEMKGATVLRTVARNGKLVRSHAKFTAVDHQYLIVTSANFSKSAEQLNVELGLVIEDPLVTQAVERQMVGFEKQLYEVVRRP